MLFVGILGALFSAKSVALGTLSTLPYGPAAQGFNPGGLAWFNRFDISYTQELESSSRCLAAVLPVYDFNAGLHGSWGDSSWDFGLAGAKRIGSWLGLGGLANISQDSFSMAGGAVASLSHWSVGRFAIGAGVDDIFEHPGTRLSCSWITPYSVPYVLVADFTRTWGQERWDMRLGLDASFALTDFADISLRGGYSEVSQTKALSWGAGLGFDFACLDFAAEGLDRFYISAEVFIR